MNERLREALRRKIARHNKFVRLYGVWSGFLLLCMWAGIYFVSRWAVIFVRTISQGVDAEMPTHFGSGFLGFVVVWFAAGWMEQSRQPSYLVSNDRTLMEIFLEVALFPPRATLSAIHHVTQRVSLQEPELEWATTVLERAGRAGKLPLDTVEEVFPEGADQERVLDALRTLDLVCVRRIKGEDYLAVTDPQRLTAFLS